MKKMKTKNKCLVTSLAIIAMLMMSLGVKAQTVHIGLDNGSLVTGVSPGNDSGWSAGFKTLWRHEQLSLTMMASDRDELTTSGGIAYPSSVFGERDANDPDNNGITIVGGRRPTFIVVSLPKGYRITGYTMVLANDLIGANLGGRFRYLNTNNQNESQDPSGPSSGVGTMRFYEVKPWKTDHTNSGTTQGTNTNNEGYNATYVRNISLGTDVANGQIGTTLEEVLAQAKNGTNGDIRTDDANGTEYTISRTAVNIGTADNPIYDMGNQLYFRLVKNYFFYGLTIKSFRIEFTAEGTFEADVVPSAIGPATSVTTAPFKTNKIDIGTMNKETKDRVEHYAFTYRNVEDVVAYNYLYQKNAVKDGVPADVDPHKHIRPVEVNVNNKNQLLYALESDTYYLEPPISVTHKGNTAPIGYRIVGALFTPLWGSSSDTEVVPEATYNYIKYTSEGTDYYLNDNGKFVEATEPIAWTSDEDGIHIGDRYLTYSNVNNVRTLTIGRKADTQKIQLDNSNHLYYQQEETTYYLHGTTDPTVAPSLANNADGLAAWSPTTVAAHDAPIFSPGAYKLKIWKRDGSGLMHWKYDEGLLLSTNDETADDYIEISGASDTDLGKVIDIGLCNNDAIKFEIEVEDGKQALVQVTLLLQALDPYIDKMDIVCHDEGDVLQLTQSFTADDFSVSGGKFVFYVPSDYKDELLTFTFSDLYSKYGDVTYYDGGSGSGRYHFVTSPYSFTPDNNGGGTYLDLYDDTAYDPDEPYTDKVYTSTAGNIRFKFNNAEDLGEDGIQQENAVLEEYPFSVAIYKDSHDPGDPLSTPPTTEDINKKGKFIDVQLIASSADQHSGTYFVFTADETRWNIAPTTAWEHRFYAFYRMEIDLVARTFTPKFTVEKIYDKTYQLYRDPQRDADGNIKKDDKGNILYNDNGTDVENSMYGLTLDVADTENGLPVQGYLTYQEIIDIAKKGRDAINYTKAECNAVNATHTGGIATGTALTAAQASAVNAVSGMSKTYRENDIITEDDAYLYNTTKVTDAITTNNIKAPAVPAILKTNPAEGPTSLKQILYVDGTPLYAMLNSSQSSVVKTLGDLKDELADNALVFLPENTTSTLDNVAYIISDQSDNTSYFHAGRNIVLKDKQPFYSPYDIRIDAANYASYTRELTHDGYDPDVNATIMLPFTLYVNEGLHTNEDNTCSFTVNKMQSGTNMQLEKGSSVDYGTAFFVPITGNWTEANKPYMIHVKSVNPPTTTSGTSGEGSGTEGDGEGTSGESENQTTISFIAKQKGALIVATPKTAAPTPTAVSEISNETEPYCTGLLHKGEEASATFGSDTYNFTSYGSFSGSKYDRAVSENVFYFGKNRYVNLHTLWPANQQWMYNYPFRAAYIYTTSAASPSKEMKWFDISFDEYLGNYGIATGVTDVENVVDLMVRPGVGCMTITAAREQDVNIYTANGIRKERMSLQDGETRIVNMPAGIYIVNNVKVIVK